MQDSNLRSLRHQIASRLNAHSQTDWDFTQQNQQCKIWRVRKGTRALQRKWFEWLIDWLIEIWQIKQKTQQAVPMMSEHSSPLDFTADWLSRLAVAVYMTYGEFWCNGTVKWFSDRKETSCLPLLDAGFEYWKFETPNRHRLECPLTNRSSLKETCVINATWWTPP